MVLRILARVSALFAGLLVADLVLVSLLGALSGRDSLGETSLFMAQIVCIVGAVLFGALAAWLGRVAE